MPVALLVGGLVLVVLWMASKAPNGGAAAQVAQTLPRVDAVPVAGVTATISPAMSGGQPTLAQPNDLRLETNYHPVALPWSSTNPQSSVIRAERAVALPNAVGPTNQQSNNVPTTAPPPVRTVTDTPHTSINGGWTKL